ncbi:MAG TPA: metal ABC transporter permease [Phycisphaerae bacterium]|nr:metal ABC transporter permease [Phycisphaerae bacterium]HRY69102.1 metal ABC transporter permease [Phycisphaerae bacterium]HSA29448.1 metal ABC transporter permease [Phycisphaerae bacterium]
MIEFFDALGANTLLRHALLAGIIASVACGIVGSYVVTRRITYIAGGVAHCILGGMGAARYLHTVQGWTWLEPLHGAVVAAVAAALTIGLVSLRAREREDTVISALWAIGMAVGILFIARTPGYYEDLMSYLFGNILLVSRENLILIGGLDIMVVAVGLLFYNKFLAVCFDEEFARLRGVSVEFYYLLLLCLTALTVVVLVTVVGLVLVIALLTLPVAVAGHFASRLWQMMLLATMISAALTTVGLAISYGPELPPGATTIALAGGMYLAVIGGKWLLAGRRRTARSA